MDDSEPSPPAPYGSHETTTPPFSRATNTASRYILFSIAFFFLLGLYGWYVYARSDYLSGANTPIAQPVLFSHRHHAGDLGIDCLYCHTSVEKSSFAGIPSTETCMTCHSQLFTDSPMLELVRESFATGKPIAWNRVHDLPEFVYFDHSIHVQKGIDCRECHGEVADMPLVHQAKTLHMEWCLDCHRSHQPSVPSDHAAKADHAHDHQHSSKPIPGGPPINQLTNCYTCHR